MGTTRRGAIPSGGSIDSMGEVEGCMAAQAPVAGIAEEWAGDEWFSPTFSTR